MALRNPYRNLRKRTVTRNLLRRHGSKTVAATLAKNRTTTPQTGKSISPFHRSSSTLHKSNSPGQKSNPPQHKSNSPQHKSNSPQHKSNSSFEKPSTPPRSRHLSNGRLFTPPNLTPPVTRRPTFRSVKAQRTIDFNTKLVIQPSPGGA